MRVQSQEAVDENGEFSMPEGARLLTLHTVKADGTRLEPDAIAGKSSLSLPNLAPGDYVEFETVRGESPSVGFPGGYLGDRFYFKSFEVPFDHSELVVVLPAEHGAGDRPARPGARDAARDEGRPQGAALVGQRESPAQAGADQRRPRASSCRRSTSA